MANLFRNVLGPIKGVPFFIMFSLLLFSKESLSREAVSVYFFTGGAGEVLSEIGPDVRQSVAQLYPQLTLKGAVVNWTNYQSACAEIVQDRSRGKVILIGHSYGAHAAVSAALCLKNRGNVRVDLLITLDTITNPGTEGNGRNIPSNVVINYNFFQRGDLLLRGIYDNVREDGRSRNGIFNRRLSIRSLSPHSALDNHALLLTNWIVSVSIAGRMDCITILGNDSDPIEGQSYSSSEIRDPEFISRTFLAQNCR